jgi:hypothetical protein
MSFLSLVVLVRSCRWRAASLNQRACVTPRFLIRDAIHNLCNFTPSRLTGAKECHPGIES